MLKILLPGYVHDACIINPLKAISGIFAGDDFLIASGGDDNALVVSLIKVSRDGLSVAAKGSCLSAHATEITGIFLNKRLCQN